MPQIAAFDRRVLGCTVDREIAEQPNGPMEERSVDRNGGLRTLGRIAGRQAASLSLAGLLLLVITAAALAVTGDLTQPAGSAGCVSQGGAESCANGHGLMSPFDVGVSPDGKSVYVASADSNAVARLNRNPTTGALTQPAGSAGCVSETGAGPCADGYALKGPLGLAVSADGKSVYVASASSDAVARLDRDPTTGAISQAAGSAGCVSETGAGPCADGHALTNPHSVAASADGKSIYVAATGSDAVARLNRNPTTGALTQPAGSAGCVSQTGAGPCADGRVLFSAIGVAVSPDGKSVYVASAGSFAVVRLNRNTTTGAITQPADRTGCVSHTGGGPCIKGHVLNTPFDVAVSPDGKSVYVASADSDAVARLNRNTTTGAITQPAGSAGCVSETGAGPCVNGQGLRTPHSVAVSADGKSVYVASLQSDAVAHLTRNTTTGAITQPAGSAGCVSETGAGPCADGHALTIPNSVAVSPNGRSVYVASPGSDAVARFLRAP
jgi:DNA-binding beta-propeller fold protein YncE